MSYALLTTVRRRRGPPRLRVAAWHFLWAVYPITWATWLAYGAAERAIRALFARRCGWSAPRAPAGLLRATPARYAGSALALAGEAVRPGDLILELHAESSRIARAARTGISVGRAAADLRAIARWLSAHPEVRALRARTILRREVERLGFICLPFRGGQGSALYEWFFQLFAEGYVLLYRPRGLQRLSERYQGVADAWIGREELLRRYHR
jgi:hypothetical protein